MKIRWFSAWSIHGNIVEVDVRGIEDMEVGDQLEHIFRACNRVDGSDVEVVPDGIPSMTAGDIVFIDNDPWWCASIGWTKLTDAESMNRFMALPQEERVHSSPIAGEDGALLSRW